MTKQQFFTILGLTASTIMAPVSAEVVPGTEVGIHFESAHIVGIGRNLNMARIPVVDINTGDIVYFDASFKFTLSPDKGLVFEQISSANVSPPLSASNLIPGIYAGDTSSSITYELSEPSVLSDGRLFYTLKSSASGGFTAQIVSGGVANHPDIGSREIASFLSPTYTYGVVTTAAGCCSSSFNGNRDKWNVNHLIGIRQTGNSLSVTLFSQGQTDSGLPQDFSTQRDGAVLTRVIE